MKRRKYIELTSLGMLAVAGCTGGQRDAGSEPDGTPTDTPSATDTPSPSPTPTKSATPVPDAPDIQFVNLISSWGSFGDARDNQIDEATQGSEILIATRYTSWVHDGTSDETIQIEIYDSSGNRVAFQQDTSEQIVDQEGESEWEWALVFTASWEPGEYTAEVVVRDDITGKVSETASTTFSIIEPEPLVEIISHQFYEEEYSAGVSGIAENISDQTLDYVEVSVVFLDDSGTQLDSSFDNTNDLAAGRRWQFDVGYFDDPDEVASYEISVDWSVY